ncbi:protocatechuate 3,4-dioxygenase subunit alpha [Diaminobutyricibacter sp. McL0618]|uniref:protocatechuate 3,4-dioxygenase subunit alpha n=1 Tax=Leifsonia sp. McL0618 TaxID=3415677 RepID=UPI003CF5419A
MPEDTNAAREFLQTPSQTIGPFYGFALPYDGGPQVAAPWRADAIRLHGIVYDGAGEPVPDALLEVWGADGDGVPIARAGSITRDGYTVTGFGRAPTDRTGVYSFTTVKPGPTREGVAPHLLVTVFARGLLHHLFTRAYFGDEPELNVTDPFLAGVHESRRTTLMAAPDAERSYRFDIRLQGDGETVFIDFRGDGRG